MQSLFVFLKIFFPFSIVNARHTNRTNPRKRGQKKKVSYLKGCIATLSPCYLKQARIQKNPTQRVHNKSVFFFCTSKNAPRRKKRPF